MKKLDETLSLLVMSLILVWIVQGVGGCIKMDEATAKAQSLVKYRQTDKWFVYDNFAACHSYEVTDTSYKFYLSGEVVLELMNKDNYTVIISK